MQKCVTIILQVKHLRTIHEEFKNSKFAVMHDAAKLMKGGRYYENKNA